MKSKSILIFLLSIPITCLAQVNSDCFNEREEILSKLKINTQDIAKFQKYVNDSTWLLNKEEIKFSFDVNTNINYTKISNYDATEFNLNCSLINTTANTVQLINDAIKEQPLVLDIIGSRYRKCLKDNECSGIITLAYQDSIPFVFKRLNGINPSYSMEEQIKFIDNQLKLPVN